MQFQISVGMEFTLNSKKYKITDLTPPTVWAQRFADDLAVIEFNITDLLKSKTFIPDISASNKKVKDEDNLYSVLDTTNEESHNKVLGKKMLIRPLILFEKALAGDIKSKIQFFDKYSNLFNEGDLDNLNISTIVKAIAKSSNKNERTIWKYWSEWSKGGCEGLISHEGIGVKNRKDNKELVINDKKNKEIVIDRIPVRLNNDQIMVVKDVIETKYLHYRKPRVSEVIEAIKRVCNSQKNIITPPSDKTIYNILDKLDTKVKVIMRDGIEQFEKTMMLVEEGYSHQAALFPLHIVQIDHTEFDEEVLDDSRLYVIDRPWITLGIDVFTRGPWCEYLSFEYPSANVVRKAIINGVLPKNMKETYNTFNEWQIFGIPQIIYTDNGPSFRNSELDRIIDEVLECERRDRPVRIPRYGAVIERYIGTINTKLIHTLPGTTKSNVIAKGKYDSDKEACLTLSALREILIIYLTDIYPYEKHSGLPVESPTPMVRYLEGISQYGFPDFIPPNEEEKFRHKMIPQHLLCVTREGIRHDNIRYSSKEISHLVSKRGKKLKIKIDPDDISYCMVLDEKSETWIKVLATKPDFTSLAGVNFYTWKKLHSLLVEEGLEKAGKIPGTHNVNKAKLKLYSKVNEEATKTRSARKMKALLSPFNTEGINFYTDGKNIEVDKPLKQEIKISNENVDFENDAKAYGFVEY